MIFHEHTLHLILKCVFLAAYDVYIVSESSDFIKEILLTHTPYINMKIDEEHKKKSELH